MKYFLWNKRNYVHQSSVVGVTFGIKPTTVWSLKCSELLNSLGKWMLKIVVFITCMNFVWFYGSAFFSRPLQKSPKKKRCPPERRHFMPGDSTTPWPFHPQMLGWSHLQPLKWSHKLFAERGVILLVSSKSYRYQEVWTTRPRLEGPKFTELVSSLSFFFLRKKLHSLGRFLFMFLFGGWLLMWILKSLNWPKKKC